MPNNAGQDRMTQVRAWPSSGWKRLEDTAHGLILMMFSLVNNSASLPSYFRRLRSDDERRKYLGGSLLPFFGEGNDMFNLVLFI